VEGALESAETVAQRLVGARRGTAAGRTD